MNNGQKGEIDDDKIEMKTSSDIINKLVKQGYTESFKVSANGLCSQSTDKWYQPGDIKIINFFRFEGESDPADNSILYVIETSDNLKGTLMDAYGSYADRQVTDFIAQVEEINKKG
jgi:hypothetical protein